MRALRPLQRGLGHSRRDEAIRQQDKLTAMPRATRCDSNPDTTYIDPTETLVIHGSVEVLVGRLLQSVSAQRTNLMEVFQEVTLARVVLSGCVTY